MMRSPVIRTMYKEQWKDAQPKKISMAPYDTETVQAFVDYLSTGEVEDVDQIAPGLLRLADYYGVEDLKQKVEDFIVDNIDESNAGEVYDLLLEVSPQRVRCLFVDRYKRQQISPKPIPRTIRNKPRI